VRIYIVRHGEARIDSAGERALSEHGFEQARAAGAVLAKEGVDQLLYSPKLRTRQTAAEIARVCGGLPSREAACLLPPAAIEEVVASVEGSAVQSLGLVSHLPWVAEMVAWFVNGDMRDFRLPGFPTSGVVALDMDIVGRGTAQLAWHAFPPDYGQ